MLGNDIIIVTFCGFQRAPQNLSESGFPCWKEWKVILVYSFFFLFPLFSIKFESELPLLDPITGQYSLLFLVPTKTSFVGLKCA